MNKRALLLTMLQCLFLGRVLGQILARAYAPSWLPANEQWESGFLPYPLLLSAQVVILIAMSVHTRAAWQRGGRWYVTMRNTEESLRLLAVFYALAMALRYVLTMVYAPELRWFGHLIPIAFHFVLAAYVYALTWSPSEPARASKKAATPNREHCIDI